MADQSGGVDTCSARAATDVSRDERKADVAADGWTCRMAWRFHPGDQRLLAILLAVGLLLAGGELAVTAWRSGGLFEFERLPPRDYRPQVDLNRCDWTELCLLPGISETLARRIVNYRDARGGVQRVDQLRDVAGIGVKTLERIAPLLEISSGATVRSRGDSSPLSSLEY